MQQDEPQLDADAEIKVIQEKELNEYLQELDEKKPLFSNQTQRIILLILDIVGLAIFIVYCYYIQSYLSTMYFLIFLIIIHSTWETDIYKIGMFEKKDSDKKIFKSPQDFTMNYQHIKEQYKARKTITAEYTEEDISEQSYLDDDIQYKPLYWILFKDQKNKIWMFLLVLSALSLVVKGVFLGIIKNDPSQALNLMTIQNYQGMEIYFTLSNNKFIFNAKDYVKIFLPNSLIFIFCCFVMALRRVNSKKYLEEFGDAVNAQIFSFYFVLIWVFLALILITNQSIIGYILFTLQLIVGLRLFQAESKLPQFDKIVIRILKTLFYFILVLVYFAGTPYIIQFVNQTSYWPQFFGLDVMYGMRDQNQWNSYAFMAAGLLLFTFLCIVSESLKNEERKKIFKEPINDCIENYELYLFRKQKFNTTIIEKSDQQKPIEEEKEMEIDNAQNEVERQMNQENELKQLEKGKTTRMSHVDQGDSENRNKFLQKLNETLFSLGNRFTSFVDQPIVTLRVLQLLIITIVIMQQTYESLFSVIWVMITGFTLQFDINAFSSLVLALPSVIINFLVFYYQCIPNMDLYNNPYIICRSSTVCDGDTCGKAVCDKLGFFTLDKQYKETINILVMNITIYAFFLFLRQVNQYSQKKSLQVSAMQQIKTMIDKSQAKKKEISWWTIIFAVSLKASYVVSLIIVYWIGFFDVNLIQFILVLFLLVFIINDSTLCIYKQKNEKTGEMQEYVVPFSFKYWIVFLTYICLITFLRYIYILFFREQVQIATDKQWIISLIGINNQENYDILFWILFYFAALQYDSYRSKIYLRYSNKIVDTILSKISNKDKQAKINTTFSTLYLLFMKTIIWITFTLNICFILFTPFSFINLGLFIFIGGFFVYYTNQFTKDRVNYYVMSRCWYIYLNTLILAFIIRYIFQFICLPSYSQIIQSNFASLYNNLQFKYSQYGFYQYNQGKLRLEYFPDMVAIFFGAISLNTYQFFAQDQKRKLETQNQQGESPNQIDKPLLSSDSLLDQSGASEIATTDKIEKKQQENLKQLSKIMQISILEEYQFLKKPIIFVAQINTDILTIYVVFSVVFYVQSVASFIILVLYLSYFVTVHNALLDNVQEKNLLQRLKHKITNLKKQYLDYNSKPTQSDSDTAEEIDLVQATNAIAMTRMKIRIQKKVSIWKISFAFSCFCVFLTYLSVYLSLVITSADQSILLNSQLGLFIFGTFAQEINSVQNCFCGKSDHNLNCINFINTFQSTMFDEVLFYLILVFANVVDAGCTMFLQEQLQLEEENCKTFENKFQSQKFKAQSKDVISRSMILNLKGIQNQAEGEKIPLQIIEEQQVEDDEKEMEEFFKKYPFLTVKNVFKYNQRFELDKADLERIKIAALDINYYNNRKRIFNLNLTTAGFVALQRVFILILLLNTLLANNVFSLVYLGVATYLFLQKTGPHNVRILNTFSVVAIWIQYIMIYFLNYDLIKGDKLVPLYAQDYDVNYFSVIYRASVFQSYPYFVPYLGFDNGNIMDCSSFTPNDNTTNTTSANSTITTNWQVECLSNSNVEWIFILNTLVLSLIYLYFLLLQHLSKKILTTTIKMELDVQQTQQILQRICQNQKVEIHLNYQTWKNRVYSTLSGIVSQTVKISHIVIISIIILLAQSNRILLNYFEYILAIVFLVIFELVLTSNRRENLQRERTYFKVLFFLGVITISLYTVLRLPWILDWCVDQSDEGDEQNEFICLEIFDMKLGGMIFILFFISLHFDLIDSEQFDEALKKFMLQSSFQAKMISRALAYHKNYKKFKAILQVQEQKAIFNLIQIRTQEKLKMWHAKLLDKTQEKQILQEELKTEQQALEKKEIEIPVSKEETPISKDQEQQKSIIIEERKSQEGKQLEQSILVTQQTSLTKSQKYCIGIIQTISSYNNKFKFMSMPNIMDYLLSQNIMLKRRIQLPLSDFLQENYMKFEQELIFLDQFYSYLHRMLKRNPSQQISVNSITEEIFSRLEKSQMQNSKVQKKFQRGVNLLKMNSRRFQMQQLISSTISAQPFIEREEDITYEKYVKSTDLCFVEILDDKQLLFIDNTKYSSALTKHTLGILIFRIFTELFSLTITYWMPFCFLLIIFYYTVNSGLLGGVLPFLLFVWVLIDEKVQSKLFWIIAFSMFFFTSLLIFAYTLSGVLEKQQTKNDNGILNAWYYPLYNGNQSLAYEVILMVFIIFQVNFAKNFGVYYSSLQDIENIFQGYVRMKLNKFNRFIRQQIIYEYNIAKKDDELATTEDLEQLIKNEELLEESKLQLDQLESIEPQLKKSQTQDQNQQQFQLKQIIDIERRIIEDPKVLVAEDSTLFERIFSYKYSRPGVDLYPITASIQILILIYTLIFFTNMINEQIKINNILKTNQIPNSLIWALLVEFIFMYFERLITMKDDTEVKGVEDSKKKFFQKYKMQYLLKFTLQMVSVILIYWLVFFNIGNPWRANAVYDENTQSTTTYSLYKFNGFVECFFILYSAYFTVSALQLRFGYKKLKLRNTLLQSYNQVSYIIANTYYAIPFLFELKVLMDWTFLETSLDVFQWFRLEDIQGIMYFTKNQSNGYLARPLGEKISKFMKCSMGCSLVLFIFLCIFGPLILFSSLNPATELNPVRGGEFQLSIINLKTSLNVVLYQTNQFYGLENTLDSQGEINQALQQKCNNSVINNAPKSGELQEFQLLNFSNTNWDISYPLYIQLQEQLAEKIAGTVDHEFFFNVSFIFTRDQQKIIPTKNYFQYPGNQNDYLKNLDGQKNSSLDASILAQISQLLTCVNQVGTTGSPIQIPLPNFYIETIQLYSADGTSFKPKPIDQNGVNSIAGANLSFFCAGDSPLNSQSWWTLVYTGNSILLSTQDYKSDDKPNGLIMFVVSDTYSALTQGFSIITIYSSVILLIGSFIRSLFSGQIWLLEYKGMVYPDDLLMICQAISIARSQKDYKRENMLYFELIDILRSPEIVKVMTGTWTQELKKKEAQREEQKQIEQAELASQEKPDGQKKQKQD